MTFSSLCTQNNHNNQHSSFPVRSQSAFICCLSITILFLICRNQSLWLGSDLHVLTTCPQVIHTEWSHRLATLSDGSWFTSVWLHWPTGKPWCQISSQVKCVTLSKSVFVVELLRINQHWYVSQMYLNTLMDQKDYVLFLPAVDILLCCCSTLSLFSS